MPWKKLALILMAVITIIMAGYVAISSFYTAREVSISEIVSDAQSFNGAYVVLNGYIVHANYMFGPTYVLRDFDEGAEIGLGAKGGPQTVDLEPYISFIFDGHNYTKTRNLRVYVEGYVRYIGPVTDAPSFYLDVEKVEPNISELQTIIAEFLNTTDVAHSGWNGTVEILEVHDHKLGGKIVVVNYTTANAMHPYFMCEAIEHHTAVITLNVEEEVISAFCIWGNFHNQDKIWDLANQRWIPSEKIQNWANAH